MGPRDARQAPSLVVFFEGAHLLLSPSGRFVGTYQCGGTAGRGSWVSTFMGQRVLWGEGPTGEPQGWELGEGQRLPGAGQGVLAGEDWLHEQGP